MIDAARRAVDAALAQGADYADARANRTSSEELVMKNGALAQATEREESGLGVRVLVDGTWGFAAAPGFGADVARTLARKAVASARALSTARREPVRLDEPQPQSATWRTPVEIDPFEVPLADKVVLLGAMDHSMTGGKGTVVRESSLSFRREEQGQVTSEGSELFQELLRSGGGLASTAAVDGVVQRRSYPASFGGNFQSAGWEFILGMDLASRGERVRDEAIELCHAEPCPAGKRDLILMGNQLMLQIHESVGHPNELDRVFGHEEDLAGSSFATPDKLGTFRYGSEHVNLVADSTVPGGLDTRGFDDEGTPSERFHVVRDGLFKAYHTDREWAARGGERSRSTSRAQGWYNPPIVRITNLSLMPGEWELEDLIRDTEDGVLCDTVKMWSIDQKRLNFQFTTEMAWEIKNGERVRVLRDPTYQGSTPEFWRSCDAICNAEHWQLWGVPNCGKGNPMQVAEMSHGAAPARFRGVTFVR